MNAALNPQANEPADPKLKAILEGGTMPPSVPKEGDRHRVFVLDDHPLFRFGLRRLIEAQPDMTVCGEGDNAIDGLDEVLKLRPDLITVDISLNESTNGIEFVKNLRAQLESTRILVLSMHDESIYALRALRAGAQGYLMKQEALARVVEAVRTVLGGSVYLSEALRQRVLMTLAGGNSAGRSPIDTLSDRELEVLHLSGQGRMPREIANQLGISVKTVETHRMRVREKLNLSSSAELMRFAVAWNGENGKAEAG